MRTTALICTLILAASILAGAWLLSQGRVEGPRYAIATGSGVIYRVDTRNGEIDGCGVVNGRVACTQVVAPNTVAPVVKPAR